jgi:hypothetical protein
MKMSEQLAEPINVEIRRTEVAIAGKWFQVPKEVKNPHLKVIAAWLRDNGLEVDDPTGDIWVSLKERIDESEAHWNILGEFPAVTAQLPVIARRARIQV